LRLRLRRNAKENQGKVQAEAKVRCQRLEVEGLRRNIKVQMTKRTEGRFSLRLRLMRNDK
jgi:hypothetical protein